MDLAGMLDSLIATNNVIPAEEPNMEQQNVVLDLTPAPFVADSTPAQQDDLSFVPPDQAYFVGGIRGKLIFEGVCSHCAHCGQPLTDAASQGRGLGPICSGKGYEDEVVPVDDTEALLALAQFPTLVHYMTAKYKSKGNRELVNYLVRVASLNRRSPVHSACTDAIEALGYKRLAGALRESIAVIEVMDRKGDDANYAVWVKKTDFSWNFYNELKKLDGVFQTRYPDRAIVVPKRHRFELACLLLKHYHGLCVKTKTGAHRITQKWFDVAMQNWLAKRIPTVQAVPVE